MLISHERQLRHVLAEYEFGNENTHDLSAGFADAWSRLAISGTARAFTTDGYVVRPLIFPGGTDTGGRVLGVTALGNGIAEAIGSSAATEATSGM